MDVQIKRTEAKIHSLEFNEIEISILNTALKQMCMSLDKTIMCSNCKKRTRSLLKRIKKLDDEQNEANKHVNRSGNTA